MARPLRIAHVIGGLELGGAETLLYRLATHALPGVEQHVICLGEPDWYSSRLTEQGITVHHLGMSSPLTALGRLRALRRVLAQVDPDVIQSWMYFANMVSSLVAKRSGIPVVWSIHNSSFDRVGLPSRLCAYAGGAAVRKLADFVVNCSDHSSRLHARLGYSHVANAVIPNGYDQSAFRPDADDRASTRRELGLGDDVFAVGCIARWHSHKDIPTLLHAVGLAAGQGVPLRCLLIGRGLDVHNDELAAAIRDARCEDLAHPLGARSDIPDLARAVDLHVLSSRSEAFPNVVAETMLSGTPNVVTNAGDAAAIVGDEGWVVPSGSPQKLSDAIVEAWRERSLHPAEWQRRRDASRQRIADNFTFERMARAYAEIWRQLASKAA